MNNNVGFRQYKLPNDVCLDGEIEFSPRAGGVEVDAVHGLEFAIDGREDTYCQLNGDNSNVEWDKMDLVVTFEKPIACDYVKVVFENEMINTEVRDFSDGGEPQRTPIILQQGNEASAAVENIVDREMSAIVVTNFTPNEQTDTIKIKEISVYSNEIIPPEGFYIKDIEIQSDTSDSLNGESSTKKKFLTSIDVDDFQQGEFTLSRGVNPVVLGTSASITVTKTDDGINISEPSSGNFFIKNFNIVELEQQPNVCVFTWDIKKVSDKYRLIKDAAIEFKDFKNGYRYDFSQVSNGEYIFSIQCLGKSNFVQSSNDQQLYTYPFLTIPIDYQYKYYFYYYIENNKDDTFLQGLLEAIAVDKYGVSLIRNDKEEWVDISKHISRHSFIDYAEEEGCFVFNTFMSFSNKSKKGYPYEYIVLELNKALGICNVEPVIKKIDVYVEKINAEEGESNGSE